MNGSPIIAATRCLTLMVQQRLFTGSREEFSLVLTGSETTNNELADLDGNFANITLFRPLKPYDWDLLEALDTGFASSTKNGDFFRARKGEVKKRVIILSNLEGELDCGQINEVIRNLQRSGVSVDFVGLHALSINNLETEELASDVSVGEVHLSRMHERLTTFGKIIAAIGGESFTFQDVLESGGRCLVEHYETPSRPWKVELSIGGTALRVPLIGHYLLYRARPPSLHPFFAGHDPPLEVTAITTFHLHDEAQTEVSASEVIPAYRYGATLVPFTEEDRAKLKVENEKCLAVIGFTKSGSIAPNVYVGDKVMYFVADTPRTEKTGESPSQTPRDFAAVAVSALVQALIELDSVALVRRVYSRLSAPALGVLIPKISSSGAGLIYHDLAFREDIRAFTFPSLPVVEKPIEENREEESDLKPQDLKWRPSEEQIAAMDAFITSMMLDSDDDDDEDSRGDGRKDANDKTDRKSFIGVRLVSIEPRQRDSMTVHRDDRLGLGVSIDPKRVCNPWIHRFFNLLRERGLGKTGLSEVNTLTNGWPSLDPDAFPGLREVLTAVERQIMSVSDPASASTSTSSSPLCSALRELNRVMPKIAPNPDTIAILQLKRGSEDTDDHAAIQKRRRAVAADLFGIKPEAVEDDKDNALMADEELTKCQTIGSVDPVGDFNELLRSGLITKACREMETHIYRLVDDPLTPGLLQPRSIQCLHGYRKAALAPDASVDVANAYNAFLLHWRSDLESTHCMSNRLAFWSEVIATGMAGT
ncbi:unnamed protein product [Hydatigera taeniaeformis]|uniref:Ku domain-containing protein n=1 Tax=Hydatigena taeniaeformis TaxID=6205 RepID=A0A0R3X1T0_HYDTA|nr:unnamed protein product [Hydatigera taeniaeformis]